MGKIYISKFYEFSLQPNQTSGILLTGCFWGVWKVRAWVPKNNRKGLLCRTELLVDDRPYIQLS